MPFVLFFGVEGHGETYTASLYLLIYLSIHTTLHEGVEEMVVDVGDIYAYIYLLVLCT